MTHGDDFVLTGTEKTTDIIREQDDRCVSNNKQKSSLYVSSESINALNRMLQLCISTIPDVST